VAIDHDTLALYATRIAQAPLGAAELDTTHHYVGDEAGTLAYFLTLDTINFGSGYFPTMRKRGELSGYFTVALSLKEAFDRDGAWTAQRLAEMTAAECAAVFDQDPEFPLMTLFAQALVDFGHLLLTQYDGEATGLLAVAGGSAERLAQRLTAMPYYRDVAHYDGQAVAFYKRAQLAAADLALALASPLVHGPRRGRRDEPLFHDLDRLTIFADNVVPHVLRVDGLLRYDRDLLSRINAGLPIAAGSVEEIEIRACAVHAVELLKRELGRQGRVVTSTLLDYYLWNRGRAEVYKSQPRHRSPGVYY
jgi:hypothetical protein